MGYEDDPYRDEDGEPLMDYDDVHSGRELSPEPQLDVSDDDDDVGEDWQGSGGRRERSETPVYDADSSSLKAKPRKRLIRKSETTAAEDIVVPSLVDEDEDGESFERNRKKRKEGGGTSGKKEKKHKLEKRGFSSGKGEFGKFSKRGFSSGNDRDGEVKEMWDTIAGADSEDDQEGLRTVDDDSFIDDTGVDPAGGYGSGNEPRSPGDAPQAEEGEEDEINDLFKMGKKRKKNERSPADIALLVENVMAELEVTAEEDADLNRQGKPAVNKLKKLPLLIEVLSKKQLQQEFLDHGVLNLLKNWLEPLPDGSLPNINIRAAILNILTDFPIDLEQYDRREQLKKSGLGKVIMFLSKSDEETTSNSKLAKDLVDKWSRPIFNKTTRFEEMRNVDDERVPYQRPPVKNMQANKPAGIESRDGDLDLDEFSWERKSGQSSSRLHATRPEATPLDFVVRPQSKIDPDEIRARAKQVVQDQHRLKVFWQEAKQNDEVLISEYQMSKKLQQLKAPEKKQLQATKLSVEGRGMLKYL